MSKGLLKKVTLDNVAGGVAKELFERELQIITENINDQNTAATQKRKITMTFEFTPDADRRECTVMIGAKATTAPVRPMKHTVYCGKLDGRPQMLGADPEQMEMELHSEGIQSIRRPAAEQAGE